jgi:hypothetical protein
MRGCEQGVSCYGLGNRRARPSTAAKVFEMWPFGIEFRSQIRSMIDHYRDAIDQFSSARCSNRFADSAITNAHGRADHPDAGGKGQRIKRGPKLVVSVANQEPRCHAEGVALRGCCATHACDGMRVVAANTTLRVASSMNTSVKMGRKNKS